MSDVLFTKGFSLDEWVRRYSTTTSQGVSRFGRGDVGAANAFEANTWVFRAVDLRCKAVSAVPYRLVQRGREVQPSHPAHRLFTPDWIYLTEASLLLYGRSYYEVASAARTPVSLAWLNPLYVTELPYGGYRYSPPVLSGEHRVTEYSVDEVMRLVYFHPRYANRGVSPVQVALNEAGVSENVTEFAQQFFARGAQIAGVLQIPGADDEDVRAVESKWRKAFTGLARAFRVLVVGGLGDERVTYTPVSAAPKDLALADLSREARLSVCAALGVTPVLLGAWESANYAMREWRRSFYTETVVPELDWLSRRISSWLTLYWPGMELRFQVEDIPVLSVDQADADRAFADKAQALVGVVSAGILTVEEARAMLGVGDG